MNWVQRQFLALKERDLPDEVSLAGEPFRRVQTFKHDFFAATGLYEGGGRQVVIKIYRRRPFFGLPMQWLGRISVRHEERIYRRLEGIAGVPACLGRIGPTGLVHEFIAGRPLRRGDQVDDAFFDRFETTLRAIHERETAYVDLNKPQNVLLGDDGRPYFIDFQISYAPPRRLPLVRQLGLAILRQLQREDWYHLMKHKRRLRPDLLTPEDYRKTYRRSIAIRIHRAVTAPYFVIRRLVMDLLGLESSE